MDIGHSNSFASIVVTRSNTHVAAQCDHCVVEGGKTTSAISYRLYYYVEWLSFLRTFNCNCNRYIQLIVVVLLNAESERGTNIVCLWCVCVCSVFIRTNYFFWLYLLLWQCNNICPSGIHQNTKMIFITKTIFHFHARTMPYQIQSGC